MAKCLSMVSVFLFLRQVFKPENVTIGLHESERSFLSFTS